MKQKTVPYLISRIRLVNFHNFTNETIELPNGGHLFLLGDNGCGKTTILDAIHYVLTAGLAMEWNAAARVAGSKREGRRLQGVVMRYNMDTGPMNRDGAITYAGLEIKGRRGAPLSLLVGLSTTAMDERVRQWGVVRECPLQDLPFLIEDENGLRPASLQELKEGLGSGKGFYKDAKSYRSEVANRLFSDQENYLEVCRFLAMGKAYREIASHAADYHELFKSLLPEPKTELFERIIEALRTLDRSKSDLDDLERKLTYLEELHGFVQAIGEGREAVQRYQWLSWHMKAEIVGREIEKIEQQITAWEAESVDLHAKLTVEERQEVSLQGRLDDLKAKDATGLVRQEKDVRQELRQKDVDLTAKKAERDKLRKQGKDAEQRLRKEKKGLTEVLSRFHGELGRVSGKLPFSIAEFLTSVDRAVRSDQQEQAVDRLDSTPVLHIVEQERDGLTRQQAILEQEMATAEGVAQECEQALEELSRQVEARPTLPGWQECLAAMRDGLLSPRPLYKGLEWAAGLGIRERQRLEEFIGEEVLGTLLLSDGEYEQALPIIARFPGIRVTCSRRGAAGELPAWIRTSFEVQECEPAALRCLAAEMVSEEGAEPVVTRIAGQDLLSFRAHQRGLAGLPARLIGEASRRQAVEKQIRTKEKELQQLRKHGKTLGRQYGKLQAAAADLVDFRQMVGNRMDAIAQQARLLRDCSSEENRLLSLGRVQEQIYQELSRETSNLTSRLMELGQLIRQEGLENLERKINSLEKKIQRQRQKIREITSRQGEVKGQLGNDQKLRVEKELVRQQALERCQDVEEVLKAILPQVEDMVHYILRTRKGFQFKSRDAVEKERQNSERAIAENRGQLRERLNNPEFGAGFRFQYEQEVNEVRDYRARLLEEIIVQQRHDIKEQKEIINERTKELFRKIIMTELVNYLRSHVSDLDQMMARIKTLLASRYFGGQQYRFRIKPLEKYRRLIKVIKKFSPFDPDAEEELRHFFEDHGEDIVNTEVGAIPEELDYRNWYRYEMEVVSSSDQGVVMDRRTKSMGSGGEQAVPNYLLVLTIAHFLYHGKKVRLHTLLFDEAFYGIDAGRRDQLLGFATDIGLQLFVASPDQDGVRREISYSSTILVKKDKEFDIHLFPYHWENPDNIKQVGLFDTPTQERPVRFEEEL